MGARNTPRGLPWRNTQWHTNGGCKQLDQIPARVVLGASSGQWCVLAAPGLLPLGVVLRPCGCVRREAHEYLEKGHARGKVILTVKKAT